MSANLKDQLGLIDEAEYAALRGIGLASVRNERARGKGPPYQRIGNKVFYPLDKLKKHLAAHTVTPSSAGTMVNGTRKRARATS